MTYAQAIDINVYAEKRNLPRPRNASRRAAIEREAPKLFAAARANLDAALPKPYVEAAIEMAKGAATFLSHDLANAFKDVGDAALQKEFAAANDRAAAELRDFAAWLEREKMPSANAPYALGRDSFEKMLRQTELVDVSSRRILDLGLKELQRDKNCFADTARQIGQPQTGGCVQGNPARSSGGTKPDSRHAQGPRRHPAIRSRPSHRHDSVASPRRRRARNICVRRVCFH
jgi:hypothetical protein